MATLKDVEVRQIRDLLSDPLGIEHDGIPHVVLCDQEHDQLRITLIPVDPVSGEPTGSEPVGVLVLRTGGAWRVFIAGMHHIEPAFTLPQVIQDLVQAAVVA